MTEDLSHRNFPGKAGKLIQEFIEAKRLYQGAAVGGGYDTLEEACANLDNDYEAVEAAFERIDRSFPPPTRGVDQKAHDSRDWRPYSTNNQRARIRRITSTSP